MFDAKPVATPMATDKINLNNDKPFKDETLFKEAIGCLLYIVTCTRPDIAQAVGVASRTAKPTELHWGAVKRILRYLKGTTNLGIRFTREKNTKLSVWNDADFANDSLDRKSITGLLIMLGEAPILWRSSKQPIVALSTTEVEFIAGCEAVKELVQIKSLLIELKTIEAVPTEVMIDNC